MVVACSHAPASPVVDDDDACTHARCGLGRALQQAEKNKTYLCGILPCLSSRGCLWPGLVDDPFRGLYHLSCVGRLSCALSGGGCVGADFLLGIGTASFARHVCWREDLERVEELHAYLGRGALGAANGPVQEPATGASRGGCCALHGHGEANG